MNIISRTVNYKIAPSFQELEFLLNDEFKICKIDQH